MRFIFVEFSIVLLVALAVLDLYCKKSNSEPFTPFKKRVNVYRALILLSVNSETEWTINKENPEIKWRVVIVRGVQMYTVHEM